jgi:hypothetical protein
LISVIGNDGALSKLQVTPTYLANIHPFKMSDTVNKAKILEAKKLL